eukprot:2131329-Pyramimonas_sp.AAC.1
MAWPWSSNGTFASAPGGSLSASPKAAKRGAEAASSTWAHANSSLILATSAINAADDSKQTGGGL